MEYIPLFLLMWWAFGVVLIFGNTERLVRIYDHVPALALWPDSVVLLLIFAVCVIFFPLPMLAPFEVAWRRFQIWRVKRKLTKMFRAISKGKNAEVKAEFKKMIDVVKKL